MDEKKQSSRLRLAFVEGELAERVRQTLEVEGMTLTQFTVQAADALLSQKEAQDKARHKADIVSDSVSDKMYHARHVEGLGLCLICPDGTAVTFEEFTDMFREAFRKAGVIG